MMLKMVKFELKNLDHGNFMPMKWHRLISEMERFREVSGRGLAYVWSFVNHEMYDEAVREFRMAVARWNEDCDIARYGRQGAKSTGTWIDELTQGWQEPGHTDEIVARVSARPSGYHVQLPDG